jgi:hypothetical protein
MAYAPARSGNAQYQHSTKDRRRRGSCGAPTFQVVLGSKLLPTRHSRTGLRVAQCTLHDLRRGTTYDGRRATV